MWKLRSLERMRQNEIINSQRFKFGQPFYEMTSYPVSPVMVVVDQVLQASTINTVSSPRGWSSAVLPFQTLWPSFVSPLRPLESLWGSEAVSETCVFAYTHEGGVYMMASVVSGCIRGMTFRALFSSLSVQGQLIPFPSSPCLSKTSANFIIVTSTSLTQHKLSILFHWWFCHVLGKQITKQLYILVKQPFSPLRMVVFAALYSAGSAVCF